MYTDTSRLQATLYKRDKENLREVEVKLREEAGWDRVSMKMFLGEKGRIDPG